MNATGTALRAQLTADERERVQRTGHTSNEGQDWTYEVEVPARLSHYFANSNGREHGHTLVHAIDLPDGWVKLKYRLGVPK